MAPNPTMFRVAVIASVAGMALVLANWFVQPGAALAWAAALAMFAVMLVALRFSRPRPGSAATPQEARGPAQVTTAVVFAALMMGIPLALTLADSYGVMDGDDLSRRSTGVLIGVYLAMVGNVMPKNLPALSTGCSGARQQTFLRRAGWTWALCGLGSALTWIALPIDAAEAAGMVLPVTAIVLTVFHLLRLRRPEKNEPAHGLN